MELGLGFVANHFDVVPVRPNNESCIVIRMVARAQASPFMTQRCRRTAVLTWLWLLRLPRRGHGDAHV